MRLFCFPYAGGSSASFQSWPDLLPEWIDVRPVQLPGRWARFQERPLRRIEDVVSGLGPVLASTLDMPFAFFGHSMGSVLAYETARYLRRERQPLPSHLFVSGRRGPHLPQEDLLPQDASDETFVEHLQTLGGTPPEVLNKPELLALLLPILRADFDMCRAYRWLPERPLPCPITVCVGEHDEEGQDAYARAWQDHTTRDLEVFKFCGGHFFVHTSAAAVLHVIGSSLERIFAMGEGRRHFSL